MTIAAGPAPFRLPARLLGLALYYLPRGSPLPEASWRIRHRGILLLLWAHAFAILLFGMVKGYGFVHSFQEGSVVAMAAILAALQWNRTLRATIASLGLITSSAVLTHLSGGYIEMHFHFFVMLAVIALYQEWLPFSLSILYVAVHHALIGTLDPHSVFNHPDAFAHPLKWAAIHAGFVAAASIVYIIGWRLNEAASDHAKQLLNSVGEGIIGMDTAGRVLFVNPAAERITGYAEGKLLGQTIGAVLDVNGNSESALNVARNDAFEGTIRRANDERIPADFVQALVRDRGRVTGVVTTVRDISRRKVAEEALRNSRELFAKVFESSPAAISITAADGRYIEVNEAFLRLLGYSHNEVIGRTSTELDVWVNPHDRTKMAKSLEERGSVNNLETQFRAKSGAILRGTISGELVEINGQGCILSLVHDLTDRARAEEAVRHLAYHDSLTNLPNRTLLKDRLKRALARARRGRRKVALMFVDLDRFKMVNDTVKHSQGDRLLRQVGKALKGLLREHDVVSRVGGDEFAILLTDVSGSQEAVTAAERQLASLRQPRRLSGREFMVTASIGITIFPDDGTDAGTLLQNADIAMYRAKDEGRNRCQLFTPEMNDWVTERADLEASLRRGLERDEFVLHYQPLVNVRTQTVAGMEALVRWRHPERGLMPPGDFIATAEESGLIVPLGEWVLRTACSQARVWHDNGYPQLRMAVNLSPRQFHHPNLAEMVSLVLAETGLEGRFLQVEITETTAMRDVELTVRTLRRLRQSGVQIAIDDFGTGHSSLSHLKDLPLDSLKIDQSFVRDLIQDPNDAAIAKAIIAMAHTMKLKVVAEGVETEPQLAFFRREGCDEAQAYLLARPAPAEELGACLGPPTQKLAEIAG